MSKYCRQEGCRALLDKGSYCEEHKRKKKVQKRYYSKNKSFYKSDEWKSVADAVRFRDKYKCSICHKPVFGRDSQVDHIKPIWLNPNLRLDMNNLRLVCATCHPKVEYRPQTQKEIEMKKNYNPADYF
ncbi:HNH endonuclease [Enterococcus faecalis]|uniref:HNH endonuclease n=1 Tax=Enterococcus faecalis TaxID=1351 RepID=UPI001E562F9F|nr:HNH endonuclease [Enterococcus faecalis]MCD5035209.1 HNH endonuclease [Enterococcus faecalis]